VGIYPVLGPAPQLTMATTACLPSRPHLCSGLRLAGHFMIMSTFGRYLSRTAHDHETGRPGGRNLFHGVEGGEQGPHQVGQALAFPGIQAGQQHPLAAQQAG